MVEGLRPHTYIGVDFHNTLADPGTVWSRPYPGALEQMRQLRNRENTTVAGIVTAFPLLRRTNGRIMRWQATHIGVDPDTQIIQARHSRSEKVNLFFAHAREHMASTTVLVDNSLRLVESAIDNMAHQGDPLRMLGQFAPIIFSPGASNSPMRIHQGVRLWNMSHWEQLPGILDLIEADQPML